MALQKRNESDGGSLVAGLLVAGAGGLGGYVLGKEHGYNEGYGIGYDQGYAYGYTQGVQAGRLQALPQIQSRDTEIDRLKALVGSQQKTIESQAKALLDSRTHATEAPSLSP